MAFEMLGSFLVAGDHCGAVVAFTIDFNDNFSGRAIEINNKVIDGALTEDANGKLAEILPKFSFGGGHIFAQLPRPLLEV